MKSVIAAAILGALALTACKPTQQQQDATTFAAHCRADQTAADCKNYKDSVGN